MVACEECSSPQVTGLRWYHWLELRSRWRRQQYSHFDTACQRPKGKLHFLFAVMIPPSAARYFRHLPAMSIKTTLHATAPLLYPCRRYPKCPWGLYASPPPVAMAVVGWFLCFPAFFFVFFWKNGVFFSHTRLTPKKKSLRNLHQKKKISIEKKTRLTPKKKQVTRLTPKKNNKKATYAYFHNRVTLSSGPPNRRQSASNRHRLSSNRRRLPFSRRRSASDPRWSASFHCRLPSNCCQLHPQLSSVSLQPLSVTLQLLSVTPPTVVGQPPTAVSYSPTVGLV